MRILTLNVNKTINIRYNVNDVRSSLTHSNLRVFFRHRFCVLMTSSIEVMPSRIQRSDVLGPEP